MSVSSNGNRRCVSPSPVPRGARNRAGSFARRYRVPTIRTRRGASAPAFRRRTDGGALDGAVVGAVILQQFLVLDDLPVELVGQRVDCSCLCLVHAFAPEVLAAQVHVRFHLLSQLVHREHHTDVDHVVEMPVDALELAHHIGPDRGGNFEMMAGEVKVHQALLRASETARPYSALRMLTGGIWSASRYFAIVRRATRIPCSPSMSAILLSVSGVFAFSAASACLMRARTAVADAAPPVSVATWLPKKY